MPTTETENETDDLRASIAAAMDTKAPAETVTTETTNEQETPVETQGQEVVESREDHPTDPLRYADGKFKPTKTDGAPEQVARVKTEITPSTDTQAKASDTVVQTTTVAPPAGWTAAEKAEWAKLSPVAQAAVSRREQEMSRGGQQWSDEKRRYETTLAPVAHAARSRGLTVEQGVQALIAAQNALDANPIDGIKRIAATYGVDLSTIAGTQAAEVQHTNTQPDIAALVRQAVGPILAPLQERFQIEDQQRQQSTVDTVTSFAAAPGHEHFETVQNELMAMIPTIKAQNPSWTHEKVLQDAYDRAVYANPSTRASVLAEMAQKAETQRQNDAKQRAAKARIAGASVTGSPSGDAAPVVQNSLRAEIEAAMAGSP